MSTSRPPSNCVWCSEPRATGSEACAKCKAPFTPAAPELRPEGVIDHKYEITGLLGVGGMGEVYKVRHLHLGTTRAIKVLRRALTADEAFRHRFIREARTATRVHCASVAMLHDFSTLSDGSWYMVSEFVEGTTIRQWSIRNGRLPIALALEIARQMLQGLEYIHRSGLLHRDISADNVMISTATDGSVTAKIIDLGIAKVVRGPMPADVTRNGLFVGNPRYASPEQLGALADDEEIDARADIYCMGVVLYEMLAGVPPFVARTPEGYAVKHLTELPPPLAPLVGDIPGDLEAVVFRALEKDRNRRYRSAAGFAKALDPFVSGPEASASVSSHHTSVPAEAARSFYGPLTPLSAQPRPDEVSAGFHPMEPDRPQAAPRPEVPPTKTPAARPFANSTAVGASPAVRVPESETHRSWTETPTQDETSRMAAPAAIVSVRFRTPSSAPAAGPGLSALQIGLGTSLAMAVLTLAFLSVVAVGRLGMSEPPQGRTESSLIPSHMAARLEIDAVPWARVESLRDRHGRLMAVQNSPTPLAVDLPPGRYDIVLVGPGGRTRRSVAVELSAARTERLRVDFTTK